MRVEWDVYHKVRPNIAGFFSNIWNSTPKQGDSVAYQDEQIPTAIPQPGKPNDLNSFDYSYVSHTARVAVYDDLKMPPHVIEIEPAATTDFIERLASCINDEKTKQGGKIPYGAIREVTENFIHAQFTEIVVSILDGGNTIRFCDQGPGIEDRDKAVLPGFTSAIEPMKHYIRGVGSGLPLVKEYLDFSGGRIIIEDNIHIGSVVTITLSERAPSAPTPQAAPQPGPLPLPHLTERECKALFVFATEGALGVKDVSELCDLPQSSTHTLLVKMEEANLIERTVNKKRILTSYGYSVYQQLK